jgi:glycosyltransferase involved in cell wall biosynthesis
MTRVAVVTSHPPFAEGGHLVIARGLVDAVRNVGHEAELILTPQNRFGRQAAAYFATWLTDVEESAGKRVDQVISLRFPSYAIRHPRHVCWLNHTMREYYDLWPAFRSRLSWQGRIKEASRRRLIHLADRRLLSPKRLLKLFVQSRTVRDRLRDAIGIDGEVLYPPPPSRPYRCDKYGSYILSVSRLAPHKRVDLLIRALAEPAGAAVRLVVVGDGEGREGLQRLAADVGVDGRVLFLGHVDQDQLVARYAECRAVAFVPFGEDFGFVTAEAFASRKGVVVCSDSGGPTELVTHEVNGLVAEPTATSVSAALGQLSEDAALAERLGVEAARSVAGRSWPTTVARLLVV